MFQKYFMRPIEVIFVVIVQVFFKKKYRTNTLFQFIMRIFLCNFTLKNNIFSN
jgi:ATP/ADP translocase